MKNILILCLLLTGCTLTNVFPTTISYIYINIPGTQNWKLVDQNSEQWLVKLLKSCNWSESSDVKQSNYLFEITSKHQTYYGQLSGDMIYISSDNGINKCELEKNAVEKLVRLYES